MRIRFCMLEQAFNSANNPQGHPQKVMRDLGIKYESATPESMFDCWIFEGCYNIPVDIPPCLKLSNKKDK